jgi:hypothetical protein
MNSNINSENNQYQNQDIEKLRLVNQYLEKITEIDPSNKLRSLQRLDHLIGLNNANKDLSELEHPNFEKIVAATPKTVFFSLPFVSFVSFVVRLFQNLNSN